MHSDAFDTCRNFMNRLDKCLDNGIELNQRPVQVQCSLSVNLAFEWVQNLTFLVLKSSQRVTQSVIVAAGKVERRRGKRRVKATSRCEATLSQYLILNQLG